MIKLALITGATSGIGEAIAHLLESKGIATIVSGRNASQLEQFKGQKVVCDLSKDRSPLIKIIQEQAPDLIINNAGLGVNGNSLVIPTQDQLNLIEVNVTAALEIALEGAKALAAHKRSGTILNVSSAASFQPMPYMSVYAASKAFLTNVSQGLDAEFSPSGIRVLAFCPGMIATNFASRASKGVRGNKKGIMTAEYAADRIWKQIESGNPVEIVNWKYHLVVRLGQFFIPNCWITKLIHKQLKSEFRETP